MLSENHFPYISRKGVKIGEPLKKYSRGISYTADWSSGLDGWLTVNSTATRLASKSDGATSKNNVIEVEATETTNVRFQSGEAAGFGFVSGQRYSVAFSVFFDAANTTAEGLELRQGGISDVPGYENGEALVNVGDTWLDVSFEFVATSTTSNGMVFRVTDNAGTIQNITVGDKFYLADYVITSFG